MSVQAKLRVSAPDDPDEHEADAIADRVMRMPAPVVQRSCAACDASGAPCPACEEEERAQKLSIRRKARDSGEAVRPSAPDELLSHLGSGRELDRATRDFLEPRFGWSFGGVRVHTDPAASASARSINAHAYTAGPHIVFGEGQYSPRSSHGARLLAHELTHVVQQSAGGPPVVQRAPAGGVDDAKVRAIIDDAMKRNGYDAHKALSDIVALRNKPSKENCADVNLAAADHYLFAYDLEVNSYIPAAAIAAMIPIYSLAKLTGIKITTGMCEPSPASTAEISWGFAGLAEGMAEYCTPKGPAP